MPEPVINLQNVSFRRKERYILSEVNWCIEKGRHWALLGANGSGKTMLLKIITGYEWPTSGEVSVLGHKFGDCAVSQLRKTVGWVSSAINLQLPLNDTALEITVSGFEASIGLYREYAKEELNTAKRTLEMVSADHLADQPLKILSQGERQRVLIARALVNKPQLLILDEPCIGLDPAARQHFLNDLDKLSCNSISPNIIFVTHHIEEICPWITDVFLLKNGRALACGGPEDVLTDALLSELFDCNCRVNISDGKYSLTVQDNNA